MIKCKNPLSHSRYPLISYQYETDSGIPAETQLRWLDLAGQLNKRIWLS